MAPPAGRLFAPAGAAAALAAALPFAGLTAGLPPAPPPPSFAADVLACLADVETLSAEDRTEARYLVDTQRQGDDVRGERKDLAAALSFQLNSVGDPPAPVRPTPVAPGIWRVLLSDYNEEGRWRELWEKLADVDPWHHTRVEGAATTGTVTVKKKVERQRKDAQGRPLYYTHPDGRVNEDRPAMETVEVEVKETRPAKKAARSAEPAYWLAPTAEAAANLARLSEYTGSKAPVLRAEFFIDQTGQAADRSTGYYEWLGVGKAQKDFDRLAGVNPDAAAARRSQIGDAVRRSIVTLMPREIYGELTFHGGRRWTTRDFDTSQQNRSPEDRDNNPLRLLDGKAKAVATEQYAPKLNGLFDYWLANGEGVRQDSAPDRVASTVNHPRQPAVKPSADARVHAMRGCVTCHLEGLRPVEGWVRSVFFDVKSPLQLNSPDAETRRRNRQLYQQDMAAALEQGRQRYRAALAETNGLTPEENAAAYARAWYRYRDRDRTFDQFAAELYTPPERLRAVLTRAAAGGALDPVLSSLLAGQPVRLDDAEAAYGVAQDLLRRSP